MPVPSRAVPLTLLTVVALAACGDSAGPEGEAQDFSGSYTLLSMQMGVGANVDSVPGTSGTMQITATTYEATFTIADTAFVDQGTYTAVGTETAGTFTQQSTTKDLQYVGTYSWDLALDQLTLDTTAQSLRTILVLQKN